MFHGVSDKSLLDHLMARYGKIHASDLDACRKAMTDPIEAERPPDLYFQLVEDAIQFAQDRKPPFTQAKILQTAYNYVNKTGL